MTFSSSQPPNQRREILSSKTQKPQLQNTKKPPNQRQKNPRFNLFAPPSRNDIRVAYIDPNIGLVEGVTIPEANEYASKNPGTTFIFRNGNNVIQYLNINEVNDLNPNDLASTDECGGIDQRKECGPPRIQFFGGGGIGAAGNPIIGRDGSLLAVDVVRGGNGYQYPPLVAAKDNCNYGSGATLISVLGEVVETIETYENEADFEEYEIYESSEVGYGKKYGPNGEEIGPWEPSSYTNPGEDPIRNQIKEFEEIVRKLARSPFWTTRKNNPTKISSSNTGVIPRKYDVTDETYRKYQDNKGNTGYVALGQIWNEFMNTYAISPVSPSNFPGTDYATDLFIFEWEEEFPYDGEYIFRGSADGAVKQLYVDNLIIGTLSSYNEKPKVFKKTITKGIHKIRIDLLNGALTSSTTVITKKVFDSLEFSEKANRTLWRVNPFRWGGTNSFNDLLIKSGILPFDPNSTDAQKETYGGEHSIVWSNIGFPIDGQYTIQFAVDDSVDLTIGDFKIVASGNDGKRWREITKTHFFKAGSYTITAILKQSYQGALANENPMGFAMVITVGEITSTITSSNPWNNNPMGVSLVIDAPEEPPVPQEPNPQQEGRCPPNPIWTTRFSGAKETWYPVNLFNRKSGQGNTWGKFMNRYAISPVKPLDIPGTDAGGVLFTNSWEIDIPYDGFYGVKGNTDNIGRLLIDGNEISKLDTWRVQKPSIKKVFINKGRHVISVELENSKPDVFDQIDQKIFRTKDWQVSAKKSTQSSDISFTVKSVASSTFSSSFTIKELGISISKPSRTAINQTVTKKVNPGKVYTIEIDIPQSKDITLFIKGNTLEVEDLRSNTARDLYCSISKGRFFDVKNGARKATCKFVVDESELTDDIESLTGGTSRDGVTYEGPPLFAYKDNRWGTFMNNHSVSPVIESSADATRFIQPDGRKRFTWKGVKFPENGQYDITFLADSNAKLIINGQEVLTSQGFAENPQTFKVNITQGIYDVIIDSDYPYIDPEKNNEKYFREINPSGIALVIRKKVSIRRNYGKSWEENPMGIAAALIPPPCGKLIKGKGVVTDVIVNDPGNGYLSPIPRDQGYPVSLRLKEVRVENPGINYSGNDQFGVVPNGAIIQPVFGPFGTVKEVKVLNPGLGFTEYPQIRLISETGVNASFRPVFEVVRDPIVLPEKLIQVTDLVGLKQTGYVDGRAYYGAVYYENGVRFAGFYETAGEPVRVYDTLQESINAVVTTPASAIERQGTDITSNDPRLNIPGTPENLI